MNRASPQVLRHGLVSAQALANAGIAFVCMPVDGEEEYQRRALEASARLEKMAVEAEKQEPQQ